MYSFQSLRSATSFMENFHCLAGSSSRARRRRRCSALEICRKNLSTKDTVAGKMSLKGANVFETLLPYVFAEELGWQLLARQHFRMDAHHNHLFIIRAVENADSPAGRQADRRTPEEVMIELVRARRLERMNLAALRIDAAHHVLDDAVLAGGVHALQHYEQRPLVLSVKALL